MALPSSPTASHDSSYSSPSPFSSSGFPPLPVTALRGMIVDKILKNRVTLIVGETGCGKSSQVPQFLLEENMAPILCTQPRRFAVVAVAKMVAKARNCELGEEVGYHIGHSKHLSSRSKIIFKTAGVVLDEMRDKGSNALKYKVIVLDEVHERSVESDLVLVCVKQFLLRNNDLRLVLMSATADISRYRDYFNDLGRGERVEVLGIPSSNEKTIFQRRISYIEQVTRLLGISSELLPSTYCSDSSPSVATADIKPEIYKLIRDLIVHIHKNEPDIEKSILVFLPTYYALEQQWSTLKPFTKNFKVEILHRCIDTEQALKAMRICKSHRKIILATNIAESSVTIPKVAFVIDSCRSLQVFWDARRKRDAAELVWVSKSQADQRGGRTGRTCDGQIYRLVTKSFFSQLDSYECPAILRLSLRQQVLHIASADSRAINDPKVLLHKALDPPEPELVEDALDMLAQIRVLEKTSPRGRYEPTFFGRLLASLSLSFDASMLVVKFGEIGMLREGILLGIIMDTQPLPIIHPFGDEPLFTEFTSSYFSEDSDNTIFPGRKEVMFMANLCAFQFWQRVFRDQHRLEYLKQLMRSDGRNATMSLLPNIEEEWCSFHNIVQSSLHQISELYEDILNSVHRLRPNFLGRCNGLPTYYSPYEFQHACLLENPIKRTDSLFEYDYHHPESSNEIRKCVAAPFVASKQFQNIDVADKLCNIIKEVRVLSTQEVSSIQHRTFNDGVSNVSEEDPICVYFMKGSCMRGNNCPYSHSLQAKRPTCKFFLSSQGCKNGDSCYFSHDIQLPTSHLSGSCLPEDTRADAEALLQLLPTSSKDCVLVVDDTDMHYTKNLARQYDPTKIISTSSLSDSIIFEPSLEGVKILWGLRHPYETIISKDGENTVPWDEVKCVLWFLNLDDDNESLDVQKTVVQNFFEYLAIRILGDTLYEVRVILIMNNLKFAQLKVEKLARDCFFFLTTSFPLDTTTFGDLGKNTTNKPMIVSRPISYVFDLHPPSDIQFGDYSTILRENLHSS